MSKTETLRQLTAVANAKHVEHMTQQIEALRQAKFQSVEEFAAQAEPLFQAMVALTDETRQTLAQLREQSTQQMAEFQTQSRHIVNTWQHSTQLMEEAARNLTTATHSFSQGLTETVNHAAWRLGWKHYMLTVIAGVLGALLTIGLWGWLSPKPVSSTLPSKSSATVLPKLSSANSTHSG
jgi:translation initiation factor 2B subunit (eIF-2B alpha/beta/delta family)